MPARPGRAGGQIPGKVGGKQPVSTATSPAFQSAAGCERGGRRAFSFFSLSFSLFFASVCRFGLGTHRSERVEDSRYPAELFQRADEPSFVTKGDYDLNMSAAMDVGRNSEVTAF